MAYLKEFWVVTENALYHVMNKKEESCPYIAKVKIFIGRFEDQVITPDVSTHIGIMVIGIIRYRCGTKGMRKGNLAPYPGSVNIASWEFFSKDPVAFFLDLPTAVECYNARNHQLWDERWIDETRKTLRAIGDKHPLFIVDPSAKKACGIQDK